MTDYSMKNPYVNVRSELGVMKIRDCIQVLSLNTIISVTCISPVFVWQQLLFFSLSQKFLLYLSSHDYPDKIILWLITKAQDGEEC